MSVLQISLFRNFEARYDGQPLSGFDARRVQELFAYLLLYRDRPHPRESLAELLWPQSTTAQSMKYLRQTLWQLQTALDVESSAETPDRATPDLATPDLIRADAEWLHLNPRADLELDVARFEGAYARVQEMPGRELNASQAQIIQQALDLYRGDLLEGWYQDWCLFERERLQGMYLSMLQKRMAYCEAHGQYEAGLACGTLVLRHDVAHERVHRRLMRLHYLSGDRTAALRQYERCVAFLCQELGVEPSRRTVALYEQIRSDRLAGTAEEAPHSNGETATALPHLLQQLEQLQSAFAQAQGQLHETIQAVKITLNGQR